MVLNHAFRRTRVLLATAILVYSASIAFSQSSEKPAAPQGDVGQAACAQIPDSDIPLANTMQAKVTNPIEASHLKPGKKIWVNAAIGMIYPGCRLENDAAIYGTVTAASTSKDPASAELSIDFNSADCTGHSKQNVRFVVIGVVAPPDQLRSSHNAMPTEVSGGARQISNTVAATNGYDAQLNPGGAPDTVKPGVVVGFKNLKLEPQAGPQCSAKLSSSDKNIQLAAGAILLLAVPGGQ